MLNYDAPGFVPGSGDSGEPDNIPGRGWFPGRAACIVVRGPGPTGPHTCFTTLLWLEILNHFWTRAPFSFCTGPPNPVAALALPSGSSHSSGEMALKKSPNFRPRSARKKGDQGVCWRADDPAGSWQGSTPLPTPPHPKKVTVGAIQPGSTGTWVGRTF